MARKWLEGAAELRQETVTKPFIKTPGKRADELISGSLNKKTLPRFVCEGRRASWRSLLFKAASSLCRCCFREYKEAVSCSFESD